MSNTKSAAFDTGIDPDTVAEGAIIAGTLGNEPVIVVNSGGQVCAFSGTCPHLGAPLEKGILAKGEIRCPWHHARFSAISGEAVGAPAWAPLKRYGTMLLDGKLHLRDIDQPQPPLPAARRAPRVVIVGGGAAGHACAEWLHRNGHGGTVTVLSDEPDAPYDRTFCSKQYLSGTKTRAETRLSDPDIYSGAKKVNLRLNGKVQAIDPAGRTIALDGGERIGFDVLVLAMGADPKRPALPGMDHRRVHVLRTLRDADALLAAAAGAQRIAIIGASFIGLEVAASLRQRKLEIHVVMPDEVPLQKTLGKDIGRMIQVVHEEKGVIFHPAAEVRCFDGKQLQLGGKPPLDADLVVLGTGVAPRIGLARDAGLQCQDGGVRVDERLQTSHAGIFAVGDIANYPDACSGQRIRVEHWVHAQRQGQYIARRILGETAHYTDLPFFWTAHFDTQLRYEGHVTSAESSETEGSVQDRDFSRTVTGSQGEKALITCGRDQLALRAEAEWRCDKAI